MPADLAVQHRRSRKSRRTADMADDLDAVKAVCSSVSAPVNILVYGALAAHSRDEFAKAGAARVSLGGALAFSAYGALVETARSVRESGSFGALGERRAAMKIVSGAIAN